MSPGDRAKQFMPFAALKGLPAALAQKERIVVQKRELSEEYKDELDRTLSQIQEKDIITVVYFHNEAYIRTTGMVARIDRNAGYIMVVNTKIACSDIVELTIRESS